MNASHPRKDNGPEIIGAAEYWSSSAGQERSRIVPAGTLSRNARAPRARLRAYLGRAGENMAQPGV